MKQLHRKNLYGWSEFNQEPNLSFHSVLWVRESGNVLIDPETYELLRNKRIEWMFNADNTLISVNIKHDEGKVEYVGEIKGE